MTGDVILFRDPVQGWNEKSSVSDNRDAHKALQDGRRRLETATREVDRVLKEINSGALLFRPPAEDVLKRRRDLTAEYTALTRTLKIADAALADALTALERLDTKLMTRKA